MDTTPTGAAEVIASPLATAQNPGGIRRGGIVLADATVQRRALAVAYLTQAGYDVEAHADPAQAWPSVREHPARLAILEVAPPS